MLYKVVVSYVTLRIYVLTYYIYLQVRIRYFIDCLPCGCFYSRNLCLFFGLGHYLFTQLSEVILVSMAKSHQSVICIAPHYYAV